MTIAELQQQKLDEISADYVDEGYDIRLQPSEAELPEFLKGFRPDLLATSRRENVVVEVIPATESLDEMKRLASAVDQQPGWRYEVTFVSQPVAPDIPAQEPLASDEQVNRLLKGAEELGGHDGNIEA